MSGVWCLVFLVCDACDLGGFDSLMLTVLCLDCYKLDFGGFDVLHGDP